MYDLGEYDVLKDREDKYFTRLLLGGRSLRFADDTA